MKTFVGSGSGATSKALQEATSGLQTPKMIMFIAPYEQLADTAKLIKEKYPNAMSFGTCVVQVWQMAQYQIMRL
ncbi:hypothetical protein [Lachnobacterium bovis]|uniref:hypothetical protein n=1 Tax=Lachnobacterium bovis TaxID=140626 RepID=UPI000492034C|nr:hypothetical protein [Lachnobacterium bovis]